MSELGNLIQQHIDSQKYPPSLSQIARRAGVSKQIVSRWVQGDAGLPRPENLRRLSQVIEVPYQRVLEAALVDAGYYSDPTVKGSDGDGRDAAPTKRVARARPIGQKGRDRAG